MKNDILILIQYLLIDYGLTQNDLAIEMGVATSTVSRWICGERGEIPITQVYAIIHYFYTTLDCKELGELNDQLQSIIDSKNAMQKLAAKVRKERREKRIKSAAEIIKERNSIINKIDEKYDAYQETASTDEWIAAITRRIPINEQG